MMMESEIIVKSHLIDSNTANCKAAARNTLLVHSKNTCIVVVGICIEMH